MKSFKFVRVSHKNKTYKLFCDDLKRVSQTKRRKTPILPRFASEEEDLKIINSDEPTTPSQFS